MSQTSERAKSRLKQLAAIEPLLSALRTISMGNWQVALNKLKHIQQYESHYNRILYEILPAIDRNILGGPEPDLVGKVIILVIGTEHGLCGRFNDLLAENAINWLETQDFPNRIFGFSEQRWLPPSSVRAYHLIGSNPCQPERLALTNRPSG